MKPGLSYSVSPSLPPALLPSHSLSLSLCLFDAHSRRCGSKHRELERGICGCYKKESRNTTGRDQLVLMRLHLAFQSL